VSVWLEAVLALTIAAVGVLLAQRWWLGRTRRPPAPAAAPGRAAR
jgi:hypothetical protein